MVILAVILSVTVSSFKTPIASAVYSSVPVYARVLKENVVFYNKAEDLPSNALFTLTETYYLTITNKDYTGDFYPVSLYDNDSSYAPILGFVKKVDVELWDNPPSSPLYPTITLNCKEATILSKLPSIVSTTPNGNAMLALIMNDTPMLTYGKIFNETEQRNYYFVKYGDPSLGLTRFGYVSELTVNVTAAEPHPDPLPIPPVTQEPNEPIDNKDDQNNPVPKADDNFYQIILISAICIPALIVVYLMFKPAKRSNRSHRKYYDYDEVE